MFTCLAGGALIKRLEWLQAKIYKKNFFEGKGFVKDCKQFFCILLFIFKYLYKFAKKNAVRNQFKENSI